MKSFRHIVEYALYRILVGLVAPFTENSVNKLGRRLGPILFRFGGKRRRVIETNLDIAYGSGKTKQEKQQIALHSIIHITTVALQYLWIKSDPETRIRYLFPDPPEGRVHLEKVLDRGKGVFLLTAHYGNWEAMAIYLGFLGFPSVGIARKLDNPYLEEEIKTLRTCSGNTVFYKNDSPIKLVRTLKNNECIGVLLDQNTARDGVFVDFFGKSAATARSVALLSLSVGSAIVPMFCRPAGNGRYRVHYAPEVEFTPTGDKHLDTESLTQLCTQMIENEIKLYPEAWLWIHRRWKTRPPGEQGIKIYS